MKTIGFASQHCNVFTVFLTLIFIVSLFQPLTVQGQIRAGMGYLKMISGTRELGVAGTLTGALDYCYSFHANPGATGFLREWQWSATYTKWISDIYNASFLYGKRINTLWSRQTRFAFGINYLGIPEFDSSNETTAPVSGNNLLLTTSFGQPITIISRNISIGANIKYFNSKLAQYDAQSFIFDYGLLFRTTQFGFLKPGKGFLDYAILSAGISITNVGNPIQFISEDTPLPKTVRAGVALNLGTHNGLQLNLGTDYRQVRDEDGFLTLGSEVSWNQFISMRMGYSFEENVLGQFTFGGSLRLDDGTIKNIIPGRNKAVRFDLASNQNNDLFASPYHGSLTHFSIGPEKFKLTGPSPDALIDQDSVQLIWEETDDPDLFDGVSYCLIVDHDSLKIAKIIKIANRDSDELFTFIKDYDDLLVNQKLDQTHFELNDITIDDYYWAVFSFDKDRHTRFAEMKSKPIAHFQVTAPDPKIIGVHFDYSPWITQDDYQGKLQISIGNFGNRTAKDFTLSVYDSMNVQLADNDNTTLVGAAPNPISSNIKIPEIQPGTIDTVEVEWRTAQSGYHYIIAEILGQNSKSLTTKIVNRYCSGFHTIPKGSFATDDTVVVLKSNRVMYELPYVGRVFFDSNSAEVEKKFIHEWIISPPLTVFAERARNNPDITIYLKGSADPNSNEDEIMARKRALAVRDTLQSLGVSQEQIVVLSDTLLQTYRLPQKAEDARWVLQDRKYVEIMVDLSTEEDLFGPLQNAYDEKEEMPVSFQTKIFGVVPFEEGSILLSSNDLLDTLIIKNLNFSESIDKAINWSLPETNQQLRNKWIDQNIGYSIQLTDTLDRQFKTYPQQVFLKREIIGKEKMYYVIAKFAKAKALYHFYWSNLLDRIPFLLKDEKTRMRFVGHGCAIGPEYVNQALSEKRARFFHQQFLADVKNKYPELYDEIKKRIDPPIGLGEHEPLVFKSYDGETLLLGDNETPIGRQLNRRVMVHFYTKE